MEDESILRDVLAHLDEVTRTLAAARRIDEAMPRLLTDLVRFVPLRCVILVDCHDPGGQILIWQSDATADDAVAAMRRAALERCAIETGLAAASLARLPLMQLADVALPPPPPADPGPSETPVIIPLVVDHETPFGVALFDCPALDDIKRSILNAVGSHIALAIERNRRVLHDQEAAALAQTVSLERALHEARTVSTTRFRTFAEAIPQLVWSADATGAFHYCNERWRAYTGDSREELLGFGWFHRLHPDDQPETLAAWRRAVTSGEPYAVEHRIRGRDGVYRWFLCRAIVEERASDQRVVCWLGTSTDIDSQKQLETQLTRAKEAAEAANLAKSAFLANMSHEIRTPLGAILGFAELLRDDDLSDAERARYVEVIRRNGHDLTELIDDILDLSKVEAERLDIESVTVCVADLLTSVTTTLSIRARDKGLHLRILPLDHVPKTIVSDPTRLKQVLINIVGNAIKFTDRGGVTLELRLLRDHPPRLEFLVSDTGCGIAPEAQERLFQPFVQGDSSTTRKFGGTGLGLALSRKLAMALGGDVELRRSVMGQGSTFAIRVATGPLADASAVGRPAAAPAPDTQPTALRTLRDMRILVADDAPDNRLLLQRVLSSRGARVETVENGRQAVDHALAAPFDVVLMDLQMPVLDGYGATQELRSRGYDRPIIALTAHAMKGEREKSLTSGCDDHLTKPISHAALLKTLNRIPSSKFPAGPAMVE